MSVGISYTPKEIKEHIDVIRNAAKRVRTSTYIPNDIKEHNIGAIRNVAKRVSVSTYTPNEIKEHIGVIQNAAKLVSMSKETVREFLKQIDPDLDKRKPISKK